MKDVNKVNIYSWATYKKKFAPKMMSRQDSTLGFVYSIEPTLLNIGFNHTREEMLTGCDATDKPIDIIKQFISLAPSKYTNIVYYVYRHSRGYCKYLEIFWF